MYRKGQRIAALLGILFLVLLYLATLVCAIFNFDGSGKLFQACLFATIAVPLLIWIYIFLYGKLTDRHTIASYESKETFEKRKAVKADRSDTQTETIDKKTKHKNK